MKERVKVLQVTESLESGGREAFVMNLYKKINKEKFSFDFFTLKEGEEFYTDEVKKLGGNIFSAHTFNEKKGIKRFLKKNYTLYRIIKKNKYSIVHIHACTPLDYIKVLFAKILKVDIIIMHAHSSYYELDSKLKQLITMAMRKIFSNIPNYCIACSSEAADFLFTKKVISSSRYKIIDNSIELEKYYFNLQCRNKHRKLLNLEDKIVIGHVGRFSKEKNHEFIIRCFKKVAEKNSNTNLLLIGDGELKEKIEKMVNDENLSERITLLPSSKEIFELYQVMDIFWFPSLFESFGMVALEAQVSGLKVLISDTIPKKVCLSEESEMISLKEDIWCEKTIESINKLERQDLSNSNIFKQYDLRKTVQFFEKLYCGGIE